MMRSTLLAAVIGLAASTAVAAQCGPRANLVALLAKDYQEVPAAIGLSSSGRLIEILVRADGRTWTVISTSPEGMSCVLDAGGDWMTKDLASLDPEA